MLNPIGEVLIPCRCFGNQTLRWWRAGREQAGVALVTLAPELPGALPVIEQLVGNGVVVSAGHTAASVAELSAAVDAGVSYITHLFNAMAPFSHRAPGPIGVALADERLTVGLIADGIHVHPTAVAAAWRALGPDRLNLVSDAVAALGLPAGSSPSGRPRCHGRRRRCPPGRRHPRRQRDRPSTRRCGTWSPSPAALSRRRSARSPRPPPASSAWLARASWRLASTPTSSCSRADLEVVATIVAGREVHRAEEVVPWRS